MIALQNNPTGQPQVGSTAVLGEFERRTLWKAHFDEATKLFDKARDQRYVASQRGLLWQRYLKSAIKHEQRARKHLDRARELA